MADDDGPPKDPPPTMPEWLVTYGDMISLLLCFFVLLMTMSEIRRERVEVTMSHLSAQLGILESQKSAIELMTQTRRMSNTESRTLRAQPGHHTESEKRQVPQTDRLVLMGRQNFLPNSWTLTEEGKTYIRNNIAPLLKGRLNRIEIRGHTALPGNEPSSQDLFYFGYNRAKSVAEFLEKECGIEKLRIRISSSGGNEPVNRSMTEDGQNENRRVEIIMTDEMTTIND